MLVCMVGVRERERGCGDGMVMQSRVQTGECGATFAFCCFAFVSFAAWLRFISFSVMPVKVPMIVKKAAHEPRIMAAVWPTVDSSGGHIGGSDGLR